MTIKVSKASKTRNDRISNEELRAYRATLKRKLHSIIYGAFRRLKKEESLTQKDLAERLGADPALISKRLRGDANVTLNTLSDLARAMEVTINASAELWKDVGHENYCTLTTGARFAKFANIWRETTLPEDFSGGYHLLHANFVESDWNQWLVGSSESQSNITTQVEAFAKDTHLVITQDSSTDYRIIVDSSPNPQKEGAPKSYDSSLRRIMSKTSDAQEVSYH